MSGVNWKYSGAITAEYNGRRMDMAVRHGSLDLKTYPIQLSKAQFSAITCRQQVFNILSGRAISPIDRAGLNYDESILIPLIDQTYKDAMYKYKKKFKKATDLDRKIIEEKEKYSDNFFVGLGEYFIRLFNGHQQEVLKDGSSNRHAWIIATGILEDQRIKEMKKSIELRSEALIINIQDELKEGFINQRDVNELDALARLFKSLFPETTFIVTDINIEEFLTPLKEEEKVL